MNIKQKLKVLIIIIFVLPVISCLFYNTIEAQTWRQRHDKVPPKIFQTLEDNAGYTLIIEFAKGESHNHPLMAFWIEDTAGNYIQSLYVAQSIAEGYFRHGDASTGRWEPGPLRRPAALPYWGHKRGVKAPDGYYIPTKENPMPDAVTGATPKADFVFTTHTENKDITVFNVLMEINQSWDWNHYWHNTKFPDDEHYKTSSQPALVYKTTINANDAQPEYFMKPIGHSHWSGANGKLFEDLSTITTALDIAGEVKIRIKR